MGLFWLPGESHAAQSRVLAYTPDRGLVLSCVRGLAEILRGGPGPLLAAPVAAEAMVSGRPRKDRLRRGHFARLSGPEITFTGWGSDERAIGTAQTPETRLRRPRLRIVLRAGRLVET